MRFFVLLLPLPRICARQANFAFWEVKLRLKRTFRNDSIEDINKKNNIKIHGHGYPGLRSGKGGLLEMKERASTLVFQPHYHYTIHSCGALCTYSLYDKQVNGAGAWRTERFIKPFLASTQLPPVRASALRLSSQMALSLRLQLESRSLLEEGYFTNRGQLLRT